MILVYVSIGMALMLGAAALSVALWAKRAYGASSTARRMRSLEGALSELQEAVDDLRLAMRRQAAKEGMRRVRELRKEGAVEAPVASTDPEEARAATKRQARIELDMPENPVQAVLANLGGRIKRVK